MSASESDFGADEARRQLYNVMRQDIEVQQKADRALELGKKYLDVENGHLTRIDPAGDYWEAIESTDPPDGKFPPGLTLDLEITYCRRTIQQESSIALHDAPDQGWEDDPAFEAHGLYCYHGVPVVAINDVFGTVCFVSESPRDEPFSQEESLFAELIGHLLGHAIEQEFHNSELAERKQLIEVLSRVLRHNLRNDLNIVRGHTELIQSQLSEGAEASSAKIISTVDDLLDLSEQTRELNTLVSDSFDQHELDIESIIWRIATDIDDTYPDASVTVESETSIQMRASPRLETALRELLENAAKHTGSDPSVTVSLSRTDTSLQIQVKDNGPGLPEQEQTVLEGGKETPLDHGSGLGLWMVYWIVQRHEGTVETTVSDTGTSVTITLPYGPTKISVEDIG